MNQKNIKTIFHLDMDAFFASIEQRDNPEYRNKPVIVGAQPGNRGVVSASSYEARKFGVYSAMPVNRAFKKCPNGIFVKPRMKVYTSVSSQLMEILGSFSPLIEPLSVDEAFMDMTGTEKLFGTSMEAAQKISDKIKKELNLTGSIGIAPNKYLAKLASDYKKPDGITLVPFNPEKILSWLAPLNISRIWGVGKKAQESLNSMGITLIKHLQKLSKTELEKRFGKSGLHLYELCRGIDNRDVEINHEAKSISREHTFREDCYDSNKWFSTILYLARDVAQRARKNNTKGRTIVLTFRTPDFKRHSRQMSLQQPTNLAKDIYEKTCSLLKKEESSLKGLRLIGVGITNFNDVLQTTLFDNTKTNNNWKLSENAMDEIDEKFGKDSIFRAGEEL